MRALRNHAAFIEHDNPVGEVQRRLAMSDEQGGSANHHLSERGVDVRLDPRVDRARRVIEDEDARVVQDRSCKRDPLPLPSRQGQPALADRGVITARQLLDECVCLGSPRGRLDLPLCRVRSPVGNVRAHEVREEKAIFEDDAHLAPERLQAHVAHVVTVDAHGSCCRIVEARDKVRNRRFAAATRSDDGHALAGRYLQVQALQHIVAAAIAKMNTGERDLAAQRGELDRIRSLGDRGRQVEELEDALDPRASLLADGEHACQLPGRRHELGHVGREREERPEGDRVPERKPAAEGENRHLREQRYRLE